MVKRKAIFIDSFVKTKLHGQIYSFGDVILKIFPVDEKKVVDEC